jgi:hypothetical protein
MPLGPIENAADNDQASIRRAHSDPGYTDFAERAGAQYSVHPDLEGAHRGVLGSILLIMQ